MGKQAVLKEGDIYSYTPISWISHEQKFLTMVQTQLLDVLLEKLNYS